MPDSKITALTALTAADPANDMFPIVDVSDTSMAASGTTKRISINNLLAASGTATLASATITGDLTVDTSTLKVDSANNRVGIRTASPTEPLTVDNSSGVTTGAIRIYATDQSHSRLSIQNGNGQAYHLVAGNPGASNAGFALYDNTGAATRWYVDNTGVHTWQNVGGVAGTAMTLNSTGLGVGVAPSASKLQVAGNIGLPNSCIGSFETRGVFSIDVANLFTLTGAVWRQCSFLLVYSGVDENLGNPTVLQTVVTLTGLSTYNTISKNDIVGTASVAVSNDTSSGARVTVTVPTGNFGSVYVMLLGGLGATTRPSMTINN